VIPAELIRRGRLVGLGLAAVALALLVVNAAWIAGNLDLLRPMRHGDAAPAVSLPRIEAAGADGASLTLDELRGKVVILDFWATWCKPCLVSLPRLDELQAAYGERGLVVVGVNLDDPAAARRLWDDRRWRMTLVRDEGAAARYGVGSIPHQVVIDRSGVVREVLRGAGHHDELEALVGRLVDSR
jgi:cytochrome c biogenesis protein CcmG/thiol:disulfide interchange protein DsbE